MYFHWSVDSEAVQIRENRSSSRVQHPGTVTPGRCSQSLGPSRHIKSMGCIALATDGLRALSQTLTLVTWKSYCDTKFLSLPVKESLKLCSKSLHTYLPHSSSLALGVCPSLMSWVLPVT